MKETITCLICGGEFKQLSGHLKKKHGLDGKEYRKMFPNAPLMSELLIYNRTGKNNGMYGHVHDDESKEKCGSGSRGRIQTETEKNQRSKSNTEWHEDSDNKIKFQAAIDELYSNQDFIDIRTKKLQEALNRKHVVKNFFNSVDLIIDIFNKNVVKCEICGFYADNLVAHLRTHSITPEEYKIKFPNSKLYSKRYSKILSLSLLGKSKPPVSEKTIQKRNKTIINRNILKYLSKQMDLYIDLSLGNAVQCEICGEILQQLSKHLVYKHDISVEKYKELYPNALSIAPSVSGVMINANIEKWKDDDYKKNIADQNRATTIKQLAENPIFFDTKIELKMQDILTKHNYRYIMHQPCCNVCLPDMMFPDKKIAIFCDGDYWHNLPNYIERDKNQDKVLLENGWIPLRFWEHEINNNIEDCLYRFELEYWGGEC